MALPANVAAQCGEVEFYCMFGHSSYHKMLEPDTTDTDKYMPSEHGMHEECIPCRDEGNNLIDAQNCHPWCGPNEDEEQELAFRRLIDEAGEENVRGAVLAAVETPGYGAVNPARRSLVIFDCQQQVIGNLPLGQHYDFAVSVLPALPRASPPTGTSPLRWP